MSDNKSNINLEISFEASADTPRWSAQEIAAKVAAVFTGQMMANGVTVKVHGSFLNYSLAFAREKAELAAGRRSNFNDDVPLGNPAKDRNN
jgi:hypothetical protein